MTDKENCIATEETFRSMARIVLIDDVITHPNADKLQLAIVGGWQVVIALGSFKKGDKALYCEIDALVPTSHPEFSFLEVRGENIKSVGEVTYCRIKTIRLRKELSQGLIVPVPAEVRSLPVDTDVSKQLGVLKYEKVAKTEGTTIVRSSGWYSRLAAWIYGEEVSLLLPWPSFLNKSEQPRVQNINAQYASCVAKGELFEESVKLDGSSMTCYSIVKDGVFQRGVCSRNYEVSQVDIVFSAWKATRRWIGSFMSRNRRAVMFHRFYLPSAYKEVKEGSVLSNWFKELWNLNKDVVKINFVIPSYCRIIKASSDQFLSFAIKSQLLVKLKAEYAATGNAYSIQGELVGPGIQDNFEGLSDIAFYPYNVYLNGNTIVLPEEAKLLCKKLGMNYVPLISASTTLPEHAKDVIKRADGPRSLTKGGYREGIVYKSLIRDFSFKCVSNKYLEKEA